MNIKNENENIISDIKIFIPHQAEKAIEILEANGFDAYCVGGCVRDSLMGKEPDDWDICTSCKPEKLKEIFSDFKIIETGLKHGTVTVIIYSMPLEITTYRKDSSYRDHRHPQSVEFVSNLKEDLSRRDFTINSLAYNNKVGLIDYFGGLNDIKDKIIRCVGDPYFRFEEDALRILRAVRFSSTLGFSIEPKTKSALCDKINLLDFISRERVCNELLKLLTGENILSVLLEYKEVIFTIIPELKKCDSTPQNTPHHCYDVYEHTARSVSHIEPLPYLRMTMLLHDIGKPDTLKTDNNGVDHFKTHQYIGTQMAEEILNRLRFSKKDTKHICSLIAQHDNRFPVDEKSVKKFVSTFGKDFFKDYIKIRIADTLAQSEYMREDKLSIINNIKNIGEDIIKSGSPLTLKDLEINGNDLVKLGLTGNEIGEMLNSILSLVIENKLPNVRNDLINFARKRNEQ